MKKYSIELKFACLYVLMTILWAAIGKLLGFHAENIGYNLLFNFLVLIPSFVIYYLSVRQKKRVVYHGSISFKKAFVSGMILSGFLMVLGILTPVITTQILSPNLLANSIRYVVSSGMMTAAEAQIQFSLQTFIINGVLATPVFGLILSTLTAMIVYTKSNPQTQSYGNN